jgi:hypothetical protein
MASFISWDTSSCEYIVLKIEPRRGTLLSTHAQRSKPYTPSMGRIKQSLYPSILYHEQRNLTYLPSVRLMYHNPLIHTISAIGMTESELQATFTNLFCRSDHSNSKRGATHPELTLLAR